MEQLVSLKQLRIKKEELFLTLGEKRQIRTRSLIYLGIFILLFIGMVMLNPNHPFNENAAGFLEFLAGKFLVVSMYLGYRTYRTGKEIRALKIEYAEMERKLRYLSN